MGTSTFEALLRRERSIIGVALVAVTALGWSYTLWRANSMEMGGLAPPIVSGMAAGTLMAPALTTWTGADFVAMFLMWSAMMVGMMTPSASPMILMYARVGRAAARQGKTLAPTAYFVAGYLLAWTTFAALATIAQWMLSRAMLLTPLAALDNVLGGAILIAAGLYQWTSIKRACLRHCQTPLGFILQHGGFHVDAAGSLVLGLRHGLYCVGCCWALMALLFVGGIMNILWIAALAAFVLIEKLIPLGTIIPRLAGLGFVTAGLWLLLASPPA